MLTGLVLVRLLMSPAAVPVLSFPFVVPFSVHLVLPFSFPFVFPFVLAPCSFGPEHDDEPYEDEYAGADETA